MKKIPLLVKIIVPIMIVLIGAGVYLGINFNNTNNQNVLIDYKIEEIESLPTASKVITYDNSKKLPSYTYLRDAQHYDAEAKFQFGNTLFVSYSNEWDEAKLIALKDELYKNTHGDEINLLDEVIVYNNENHYDNFQDYAISTRNYEIKAKLFNIVPSNFSVLFPYTNNKLSLEYGYYYTTPELLAYNLSHQYGLYFTQYYFDIIGDAEEVEEGSYFNLRYNDDYGIRYTPEDLDDRDDFFENTNKFIFNIAASDYVYLMGSPNAKITRDYMDTKDILRLDLADKEDEIDAYFDKNYLYAASFNISPHDTLDIPFPDQVIGLPELYYESISQKTPEYVDKSEKAKDIKIEITRESEIGIKYYLAKWYKPWNDKDVQYTLVAYNELGEVIGPVKSYYGNETIGAVFGGGVLHTSGGKYYFYYYESDRWLDYDSLSFRVVVTFSDGTAVISPAVDWSPK